MSVKIVSCEKCNNTKIIDLNGELKKTTRKHTVVIKAKCVECGHEFEYTSATTFGHRVGIRY